MTAPLESDAEPEVSDARAAEQPSPALEILGDPSVGLCVDGLCEVPDLTDREPST